MIVINYEKILFFSLLYGQSFPSTTDRKITFVLIMCNVHDSLNPTNQVTDGYMTFSY